MTDKRITEMTEFREARRGLNAERIEGTDMKKI